MNDFCKICGVDLKKDLYSVVTNESVCSICKLKFVGGLPTTEDRINKIREGLGLKSGEYLKLDRYEEARKLLGK